MKNETVKVGLSLMFVVVALLACKPRHKPDEDPSPVPSTEDTTAATTTATAEPENTVPTATAKPTTTATHHVATGGGGGGGGANAPCPGPGLTRRCNGVCVNIQTDDHNCGACGSACSGGKHCDGHMSCRDSEGNL
jgi:hypothetical protein